MQTVITIVGTAATQWAASYGCTAVPMPFLGQHQYRVDGSAEDLHRLLADGGYDPETVLRDETDTLPVTAAGLTGMLADLLVGSGSLRQAPATFVEAGVLTQDSGLVVTLVDGSKFHVTVISSR